MSLAFAESQIPSGILVALDSSGKLSVVPLPRVDTETLDGPALVVTGSEQGEQISFMPSGGDENDPESLSFATRLSEGGLQDGLAPGEGLAFPTIQIDQLLGQYVVRGTGFVTPSDRVLDGRITIRRSNDEGTGHTDATEVVLRRDGQIVLAIPFAQGQLQMSWKDVREMPTALRQGLPPGEYSLQEAGGGPATSFVVERDEIRKWVLGPLDELRSLLNDQDDPLYYQVAAEHLIGMSDALNRTGPYLADALDLLERAPAQAETSHLRRLRQVILSRLAGTTPSVDGDDVSAESDLTGIATIDRARRLISEGCHREALSVLEAASDAGKRSKDLAILYRGVVLSESGATCDDAARGCFLEAIARLEKGARSDLFRARNNYAGFLFSRARDRLYNHAFQIASGVRSPLVVALLDWHEAFGQWDAALRLADDLGPQERATVNVNLARLYTLMADMIRTLDVPENGERRFVVGQRAAEAEAQRLAGRVCSCPVEETGAMIAAVAHEILADLAFRNGDFGEAGKLAIQARRFYLEVGSLAGVEGICRLVGQCQCRVPAGDHAEAIRQLKTSHFLAEMLRGRMPADEIGLSRAGFLARRAYVNELLVELLIEDHHPVEALRFVELAKARALEDVLAASEQTATNASCQVPNLDRTLAAWPPNVAALVYSLGTRRAWVFLVDTSGHVTAHSIRDKKDRPVSSRDVVARVRLMLDRTGQQAVRMRQRLLSGNGFDHQWQDELHTFYRQLIPPEAVPSLQTAETVLIVPDHILHYFPFAALVTRRDERARDSSEMIDPTFWIEEPFSICHAPSLGVWSLLRQRPDRPVTRANALGIVDFPYAPSLPGVEQDLRNFKQAFGDRVERIVPGPEAEEGRARELLHHPGLLLIATHGVNMADQPLFSHLMFQPDSENDGMLTAGELYSLPVEADLIVMSACYSGLADRSPLPGDDLFGLQRALLHSGGRAVVAGLWDVYDGTGPELIKGFFQNLNAGHSAPTALAESQRAFLGRLRQSKEPEPWLHPYFWAVYRYVGDDRVGLQVSRR